MTKLLHRLALWSLTAVAARADIAPTQFTGTNAFPIESTEIRLAHADVEIVWGNPCALRADFALVNESASDLTIDIGFPVGAYHREANGAVWEDETNTSDPIVEEADPSIISIEINGSRIPVFHRQAHERPHEIGSRYATWYFARPTLRPSLNDVRVNTSLSPSRVGGQGYKRRLSYCIWTGGRWNGPINYERVEIRFPGRAAAMFVDDFKPKTGRIEDSSIVWEFTDIEPRSDEFDIEAQILLPSVAARLLEMREAYQKHPGSRKAALRYAAHLSRLGLAKGNAGFPPQKLTDVQFAAILSQIQDQHSRSVFERFYLKQPDHGYASQGTTWTSDRKAMVQILADAGFSRPYPESERIMEAKAIVENQLQRNPRDAGAWCLYLANFWRFSFAARGHWFGRTVFSVPLRKAVTAAYENCPDDERSRSWHDALMQDSEPPGLAATGIEEVKWEWPNEFAEFRE